MLANGVTPEEMMRVLNKRLPSPIEDIDLGTLLQAQLPRLRREGGAASRCGWPALARELAGHSATSR